MGLLNPICKYDYMFIWLNTLLDIRVQGLFQKEKKKGCIEVTVILFILYPVLSCTEEKLCLVKYMAVQLFTCSCLLLCNLTLYYHISLH